VEAGLAQGSEIDGALVSRTEQRRERWVVVGAGAGALAGGAGDRGAALGGGRRGGAQREARAAGGRRLGQPVGDVLLAEAEAAVGDMI
jgi:hypothetical protein